MKELETNYEYIALDLNEHDELKVRIIFHFTGVITGDHIHI